MWAGLIKRGAAAVVAVSTISLAGVSVAIADHQSRYEDKGNGCYTDQAGEALCHIALAGRSQRCVTNPYLDVFQPHGHRYTGKYHPGTDCRASRGTLVVAPFEGVVVATRLSGRDYDPGRDSFGTVVIRTTGAEYLFLMHLSQVSVRKGQRVTFGCKLGLSGEKGSLGNPHLHLELKRGSRAPSDYFSHPTEAKGAGNLRPADLVTNNGDYMRRNMAQYQSSNGWGYPCPS